MSGHDEIDVDEEVILPINCEISCQSDCIGENEDQIAVRKYLEEDEKLFNFITKLGTDVRIKLVGERLWFTLINKGNIIQFPYVYFYFIKLSIGEGDTHYRRVVKLGFICWSRGIYATSHIEFNIYPTKSSYVATDHKWRLPYSEAFPPIEILNSDPECTFSENVEFVRAQTCRFFAVVRRCSYYTTNVLRQKCLQNVIMFPSYRLANVLKCQQKLTTKIRLYMCSACTCRSRGLVYNNWERTDFREPYCACDDLCSKDIPEKFVDAGYICDDVVFFTSDTR
jgi:hypothetical protein